MMRFRKGLAEQTAEQINELLEGLTEAIEANVEISKDAYEQVKSANKFMNEDFYGLTLPYSDQCDGITLKDAFYFNEISDNWTDDLDDAFYELWDNDELDGGLLDDYYYVIETHASKELADKIFDTAYMNYINYLTNGF